jgi:8-oxo-dGTP pyrophosphatase MutT (NUDIX family)
VHSDAMSGDAMNARNSRVLVAQSTTRTRQESTRFVRLSQLRKLRECEQVAAVCYRVRGDAIEFLLVRTRGRGCWTFPKGSAEPGLTQAQAAALEAFEEAGVHGRIEEAAFARYVRRNKNETGVNTFLCEVLRLSAPQESKRDRTWFSVEDARQRLRQGRKNDGGTEFVGVIDRAVARIQRLRRRTGIVDRPPEDRRQPDRPLPEDALRKVQFEAFAEDRSRQASFMQHVRRQLSGMRQFAVPIVDSHSREVLPSQVLQFDSARERKANALGTGAKRD